MINKYLKFLWSVILASLASYGGPEAHIGVFNQQFVVKDKYLTEQELIEYVALFSLVPGPTSTQTITAIGYQVGGPLLGLLTFLVWATPAIIIMTILSFFTVFISTQSNYSNILNYVAPMAVGFILLAAYRIGKKVLVDNTTVWIFFSTLAISLYLRAWYVFPLILIGAGIITNRAAKEKGTLKFKLDHPPYLYLALVILVPALVLLFGFLTGERIFYLINSFYRYGILVFGGGQVVVPLMFNELVLELGYLTQNQFLVGYGIVQGIPGPLFSFAAYAGALSNQSSQINQIITGIISGFALFLPGILLVYFVMPIWRQIKEIKLFKNALIGVSAAAGGLITSAGIILGLDSGLNYINIAVTVITIILLVTKKIPAPLIVLLVIGLGFIL
jgi:chromate transporter